jgi:hypothetical protein
VHPHASLNRLTVQVLFVISDLQQRLEIYLKAAMVLVSMLRVNEEGQSDDSSNSSL